MAAPVSTALPAAPSRADDGETFAAKADAFVGALEPFRQQLQEQADFVNIESVTAQSSAATATQAESNADTSRAQAQDARDSALAVVNFAGKWADLAGALNTPATVFHKGAYWNLLTNLADVTASEPANDNGDWLFVYSNAELRQKLLDEATLYADFVNGDYRLWEGVRAGLVRGKALEDIYSFTRASIATGEGPGSLEEVPVDNKRIVYSPVTGKRQGLLVEEQRTNLFLWSEDLAAGNWSLTNASIQSNVEIAPDGNATADKLVESASVGSHQIIDAINLQAGTTYSLSYFSKRVERYITGLTITGPGFTTLSGITNLLTVDSDFTVKRAPNGAYRISTTFTTADAGNYLIRFQAADELGQTAYSGDGVSGLILWGTQLEVGPTASAYMKSEAAQTTRSPDNCSRSLGDEFNSASATLYSEFRAVRSANSDYNNPLVLYENGSNRLGVLPRSGNFLRIYIGSGLVDLPIGFIADGSIVRAAFSFTEDEVTFALNGVIVDSGRQHDFAANGVTIFDSVSTAGGSHFPAQPRARALIGRAMTSNELSILTTPE